jgi:hypothetical protein
MALRLAIAPTFQIPVGLSVPGRADPVTVRVTYRWMPPAKFRDFLAAAGQREDIDLLRDVIEKIDGLEDEDGQPLRYSDDTLADLLATLQPAGVELYAAWVKEHTQAKTKN